MKNLSLLFLVVLATRGFWSVCTIAYVLLDPGPLRTDPGINRIEWLNVAVLSGWLFIVWRVGRTFFSGPTARRFQTITVVVVLALCLWLSWSLHISLEPAQLLKKGTE